MKHSKKEKKPEIFRKRLCAKENITKKNKKQTNIYMDLKETKSI